MVGLLDVPLQPVMLSSSANPRRKYAYTLELICVDGVWIGIHSASANAVVHDMLRARPILRVWLDICRYTPHIHQHQGSKSSGCTTIKPEAKLGVKKSRLDFLLVKPCGRKVYIEVKSVTLGAVLSKKGGAPTIIRQSSRPDSTGSSLVLAHEASYLPAMHDSRVALFPDTVSLRAQRHVLELIEVVEAGHMAAVIFLIQRGDCAAFGPCDELDAVYGLLLREAKAKGVMLLPGRVTIQPEKWPCHCQGESLVPLLL
eukprot:SM000068S20639  [mRNA]  locus=s68:572974:574960:- [translate_table: standard]